MSCIPGRDQKERTLRAQPNFSLIQMGIVRWVNLTDNIAVRARPEQVLEALNQLSPAGQ